MPVNQHMMSNMKSEYGQGKGERVYYALENKMKQQGKQMPTSSRRSKGPHEEAAHRILTKGKNC